MPKSSKDVDLSLGFFSGQTHFFAKNIIEHGSWAIIGRVVGDVDKDCELYIKSYGDFKEKSYIEKMKLYLLKRNENLTFANDQPNNSFIDLNMLILKMSEEVCLTTENINSIKNNPDKLHELYLDAKKERNTYLPKKHTLESISDFYPIESVFKALKSMI